MQYKIAKADVTITCNGEVVATGKVDENSEINLYQECPECHMKTLEVTAHCATCINCGYSLCGI